MIQDQLLHAHDARMAMLQREAFKDSMNACNQNNRFAGLGQANMDGRLLWAGAEQSDYQKWRDRQVEISKTPVRLREDVQ